MLSLGVQGELHLGKSLESQIPVNVKYEVETTWKVKTVS
jgi:hypothetical protein